MASDPSQPRRRADPLLRRDLPDLGGSAALSFLDLIEVRMVKAFLDKGVGMHTIRAAARTAAQEFGSAHPFCLRRFQTDGRSIFARVVEEPDGDVSAEPQAPLLDLATRQVAIREVMAPLMLQIEYEDDLSARWHPRGRRCGVLLDPRRSFGAPIIDDCGIPTEVLADAAVAEGSIAAAAQWYAVTERAVKQAVAFERWLAAA